MAYNQPNRPRVTRKMSRSSDDAPRLVRDVLHFERHFAQIPNAWLRDERLGFRARGVLAALMTYPPGAEVTLTGLAEGSPDGRTAIRSAIDQLVEVGYLTLEPVITKTGLHMGYVWHLRDPHEAVDNPGAPGVENQHRDAENQHRAGVENQHPIRTLKNTSKESSGGNHRGPVESGPVPPAPEGRCQALMNPRKRCGGRILDDSRWCEFGHEQHRAEAREAVAS